MTFIKKSLLSFFLFQSLFLISVNSQVLQDKKIETVMELKREHQKLNPKIDGYRIQLYNGLETESNQVKTKFLTLFPDMKAEIIYKAPEWKVQVGNFRTRLEADKSLLKIKEQFPGSLVVRAKINP
ncbi:MAG: SPOR domain-containing protein [Flavobacteriaceae bacterium]|nr:SPOR domain-containing protein [Flavobacteriaceae bacterium]